MVGDYFQQQQESMRLSNSTVSGNSLMRYHSAPGSFFSPYLQHQCDVVPSSQNDSQSIFSNGGALIQQQQSSVSRMASIDSNTQFQDYVFEHPHHELENARHSLLRASMSFEEAFTQQHICPNTDDGATGEMLVGRDSSPATLLSKVAVTEAMTTSSSENRLLRSRSDDISNSQINVTPPGCSSSAEDSMYANATGKKRMRDELDEVYCDDKSPALVFPTSHLNLRASDAVALLQDSVPCRLRARRGCATHPRSVAERLRRSKISEGIKKLQDLVPNMDKQTNTADMLNYAIDYMKYLKKQNQSLRDQIQALDTAVSATSATKENCKLSTISNSGSGGDDCDD